MFHIDRSFELAAVLQDDPRRSNVSRDLARGTDNDLFTTAEFAFAITVTLGVRNFLTAFLSFFNPSTMLNSLPFSNMSP